jgi:hypothetical protein
MSKHVTIKCHVMTLWQQLLHHIFLLKTVYYILISDFPDKGPTVS